VVQKATPAFMQLQQTPQRHPTMATRLQKSEAGMFSAIPLESSVDPIP
jgi:hypothetical protein